MGFFDAIVGALSGQNKCPLCGTAGGSASGSTFRCLNPLCKNFDPTLLGGIASTPSSSTTSPTTVPPLSGSVSRPGAPSMSSSAAPPPPVPRSSGGGTVEIRYLNHANEVKTFTTEAGSLVRVKDHITARVRPKNAVLTLARKRIQNLAEVEALMPARVAHGQDWPSARERQVLNYYKKHGTTSPLFEKVRAKYPNW